VLVVLQPTHVIFVLLVVLIIWGIVGGKRGKGKPIAPALALGNRGLVELSPASTSDPTGTKELCAYCGASMAPELKFCGNCGSARQGVCHACGASGLGGAQKFCPHCGAAQKKAGVRPLPSGVDSYYRSEFSKIAEENGYTGKFNWAAFLFGAFWGLYRGLWLPSLIAIVGGIPTAGVVTIAYWFIFGFRGNLMYYRKVVKGEDAIFWFSKGQNVGEGHGLQHTSVAPGRHSRR
jgi:hypothetical protein